MDGLPVQRYTLATVKLNQDATADASTTNAKSTDSPEWAAQFGTAQYPWAEAPLPAFFHTICTGLRERGRFVADTVASADVSANTTRSGSNDDAFRCRCASHTLTRIQVALR